MLLAACLLSVPILAPSCDEELAWYDANTLTIEGRPFDDLASPFDRLPKSYAERVRAGLWDHARDSAGIAVRFRTDATRVEVRWTLVKEALAMPHMPATGVSGVDLYARPADGEPWLWVAIGKPSGLENHAQLWSGPADGMREFLLYLPLYNGVAEVALGVPKKAVVTAAAERETKPIVFYGTSITQGACASRPDTPIVLVEDRTWQDAWLRPELGEAHARRRAALRQAFAELVDGDDKALYYITGDSLLGRDGDASVDGSHPNDLGFERQAQALLPLLDSLLHPSSTR